MEPRRKGARRAGRTRLQKNKIYRMDRRRLSGNAQGVPRPTHRSLHTQQYTGCRSMEKPPLGLSSRDTRPVPLRERMVHENSTEPWVQFREARHCQRTRHRDRHLRPQDRTGFRSAHNRSHGHRTGYGLSSQTYGFCRKTLLYSGLRPCHRLPARNRASGNPLLKEKPDNSRLVRSHSPYRI